jgi:hypothetical protein
MPAIPCTECGEIHGVKQCAGCGKPYCYNHMHECDWCGEDACHDCWNEHCGACSESCREKSKEATRRIQLDDKLENLDKAFESAIERIAALEQEVVGLNARIDFWKKRIEKEE